MDAAALLQSAVLCRARVPLSCASMHISRAHSAVEWPKPPTAAAPLIHHRASQVRALGVGREVCRRKCPARGCAAGAATAKDRPCPPRDCVSVHVEDGLRGCEH
jgi:hypothetical protein